MKEEWRERERKKTGFIMYTRRVGVFFVVTGSLTHADWLNKKKHQTTTAETLLFVLVLYSTRWRTTGRVLVESGRVGKKAEHYPDALAKKKSCYEKEELAEKEKKREIKLVNNESIVTGTWVTSRRR